MAKGKTNPNQLDLFGALGVPTPPPVPSRPRTAPRRPEPAPSRLAPTPAFTPRPDPYGGARVKLRQELPELDEILTAPLTYDITNQVFVSYACARGIYARMGKVTPKSIALDVKYHGNKARPNSRAFRYTQAKLQDAWEIWQGLGKPNKQHVRWLQDGQPDAYDEYERMFGIPRPAGR